jgi:Exportin 1-like protein/Importin-beta N-terminal domain
MLQVSHPLQLTQNSDLFQVCEQFKMNVPQPVQVAQKLVTADAAVYVQHFGIQLLERRVRSSWATMDKDQRVRARALALDLLAGYSRQLDGESAHDHNSPSHRTARVLMNKSAIVMVEIAKRSFPDHWDGFFRTVFELFQQGVGVCAHWVELSDLYILACVCVCVCCLFLCLSVCLCVCVFLSLCVSLSLSDVYVFLCLL